MSKPRKPQLSEQTRASDYVSHLQHLARRAQSGKHRSGKRRRAARKRDMLRQIREQQS